MALVGTPICGSAFVGSSPITVAYTEQAAGDQIAVGAYDILGNAVTGVTDNGSAGGSTYSLVATSGGGAARIYGTTSSASGVTTISIAGTVNDTIDYCVQEYSGAARFGNSTSGTTNSPYSFTLTTQDNGNHVFSLLTLAGGSPCTTPTATTGTIQASSMVPFKAEWSQDVLQTAAGTATVSGSCSGMSGDAYIAVELRTQ